MASDTAYLHFILERLNELNDITYRPMMGEYILYYRDKVIGGIYDNRFLVKPVKSAIALFPNAPFEEPYKGAKRMLSIDDSEDKARIAELIRAIYHELPPPKIKKK